jgi:hypothetical protein
VPDLVKQKLGGHDKFKRPWARSRQGGKRKFLQKVISASVVSQRMRSRRFIKGRVTLDYPAFSLRMRK